MKTFVARAIDAHRRSLRAQLQVALGLMLVPLVAVGTMGWAFLHNSSAGFERASSQVMAESAVQSRVRNLLGQEHALAQAYVTRRDVEARDEFRRIAIQIDRSFATLATLYAKHDESVGSPGEKWMEARASAERAFAMRVLPADDESVPYPLFTFHELADSATGDLGNQQAAGFRRIRVEAADARDDARTELVLALGGFLLSIVAAVVIARRLGRTILRPLRSLEEAASRLSDDDLSARVEVGRRDELGRVSEVFNLMAQRLAKSREELRHQAFHDSLTGIPNRALFADRVDHALVRARRHAESVAVLLLDLDDFKNVNDTLGHSAGDQLLNATAQRILGCCRTADTAARLGGDEFAILLEDIVDTTDAARVADRLLQALEAPFGVSGRQLRVGASIGLAISATGSEKADELLRNADLAMYSAKRHDRGSYKIFEPSMHAVVVQRLKLEADLRTAIDRREFVLQYQPVLELESGQVVGAEALVRWQDPERGLVLPGEFIATAENTGLIVPIGRWVLEQACADAQIFQAHCGADSPFDVCVNLSPGQLHHPSLVEDVSRVLRRSVHPVSLVLEITEGAAMHDVDATIRTLQELKDLGVLLALDDFGTGYSSLSHLRRLPIDILKIDRAFTDDLTNADQAAELMREIVGIGRTLGLRTVAEGIERGDQALALRQIGCDLGQGYLFSKPLALEAFVDFLTAPGQVRPSPPRGDARLHRVV